MTSTFSLLPSFDAAGSFGTLDRKMNYTLKREIPTVADYINIRVAAGLSRKSEEAARIGLAHGLFSVVVYYGDAPIGIGRVIGDGGCFLRSLTSRFCPRIRRRVLVI
jgi:hypothetical protein